MEGRTFACEVQLFFTLPLAVVKEKGYFQKGTWEVKLWGQVPTILVGLGNPGWTPILVGQSR